MNENPTLFTTAPSKMKPAPGINRQPRYRVIHNLTGQVFFTTNYLDFVKMELGRMAATRYTIHDQQTCEFFNAESIFNS